MSQDLELREQLLQVGFRRQGQSAYFSDGTKANNKLELDCQSLRQHDQLHQKVIAGLGGIVSRYEPEFVIGVPSGATGLATEIAKALDLYDVHLKNDSINKTIDFATLADRDSLRFLTQGVLIEDVYRTGSNIARTLELEELAGKIVGIAAVFDRGELHSRRHINLPHPVQSLAALAIPPMLTADSYLWRYAS